MQTIGWIATILSIAGIFFNANKRMWCWPIWIFSNILWIIYFYYVNHDVPSIILWIVFSVFNIYGWYTWSKKKPVYTTKENNEWIDVNDFYQKQTFKNNINV